MGTKNVWRQKKKKNSSWDIPQISGLLGRKGKMTQPGSKEGRGHGRTWPTESRIAQSPEKHSHPHTQPLSPPGSLPWLTTPSFCSSLFPWQAWLLCGAGLLWTTGFASTCLALLNIHKTKWTALPGTLATPMLMRVTPRSTTSILFPRIPRDRYLGLTQGTSPPSICP